MVWEKSLISLQNLLVELYPDNPQRVAEEAGLPTGHLPVTGRPIDVWHEILKEANRRRKIQDIIVVACREFPERENELQEYLKFDLQSKNGSIQQDSESLPPKTTQQGPGCLFIWKSLRVQWGSLSDRTKGAVIAGLFAILVAIIKPVVTEWSREIFNPPTAIADLSTPTLTATSETTATPTLSSTAMGTVTSTLTPSPTNTILPSLYPECRNAQVEYFELDLIGPDQQIITQQVVPTKNVIALQHDEIPRNLIGRPVFSDPNVERFCSCDWKYRFVSNKNWNSANSSLGGCRFSVDDHEDFPKEIDMIYLQLTIEEPMEFIIIIQ